MASRGRHYRVAKKEIESNNKEKNGFYVCEKSAQKYLIISVAVVLITFINGLILGYFLGDK